MRSAARSMGPMRFYRMAYHDRSIRSVSDQIKILVTGGTFDKEYNEITGELFFQNTHLEDMLQLGRSVFEVDVETLMMIDSLQMTDEDRQEILDRCRKTRETRIVIT